MGSSGRWPVRSPVPLRTLPRGPPPLNLGVGRTENPDHRRSCVSGLRGDANPCLRTVQRLRRGSASGATQWDNADSGLVSADCLRDRCPPLPRASISALANAGVPHLGPRQGSSSHRPHPGAIGLGWPSVSLIEALRASLRAGPGTASQGHGNSLLGPRALPPGTSTSPHSGLPTRPNGTKPPYIDISALTRSTGWPSHRATAWRLAPRPPGCRPSLPGFRWGSCRAGSAARPSPGAQPGVRADGDPSALLCRCGAPLRGSPPLNLGVGRVDQTRRMCARTHGFQHPGRTSLLVHQIPLRRPRPSRLKGLALGVSR